MFFSQMIYSQWNNTLLHKYITFYNFFSIKYKYTRDKAKFHCRIEVLKINWKLCLKIKISFSALIELIYH